MSETIRRDEFVYSSVSHPDDGGRVWSHEVLDADVTVTRHRDGTVSVRGHENDLAAILWDANDHARRQGERFDRNEQLSPMEPRERTNVARMCWMQANAYWQIRKLVKGNA